MIVRFDTINQIKSQEVDALLGKSYSLFERLTLGGTGSGRFRISEASREIAILLLPKNDTHFGNIELRREGIIFGFRSYQKPMGWIIPYRKLSIFKNSNSFSIHADGYKVVLEPATVSKINLGFLRKLQDFKTNYTESLRRRD